MPPVPDQSQFESDLGLTHFPECNNASRASTCTILFMALLLVFYALALWDRWLNLKLRESQKLQGTTPSKSFLFCHKSITLSSN
ncbi:hypothetical protein B0H12DRAFT_1109305 [Mycena haematopus]|nr:hypothetical protein B0H12DRAFT_1109305 [Mycena haematopus]